MTAFITVCPFCLTLYMIDFYEGELCPTCGVEELISYYEYSLRLNTSFMDALEEERGNDS